MLVISACTLPHQTIDNKVASLASPSSSPSPSPTPTTAFAAAGPGFHAGEVGIAYPAVALTAGGGVKPYRWSVSSGALPPGLTLGADGTVSGTPASAGHFNFIIEVADSGDSTATVPGAINIAQRLTASLLPACATYCRVEIGCANACGAFGTFTGGIAPYTFSVKQGRVPVGTKLSPSSLTLNGTFGGNPGYLQFTVQVGDAFGATTMIAPKFWMYAHISVAGDLTSCMRIFTDCSLRLPISGGVPGGNPSVSLVRYTQQVQGCWYSDPTPPPGYLLTVSGGYVVIDVPRPSGGYGAIWTVVVTDHTYCAANTYCTSPGATVNIGIECT